MEELFETVVWEVAPPQAKSKPTGDPAWARVCAASGGVLLVAAGVALVALQGLRWWS